MIKQLTKEGVFIREWNSVTEIEEVLSVLATNVSKVLNGHRTQAGGFKWERVAGTLDIPDSKNGESWSQDDKSAVGVTVVPNLVTTYEQAIALSNADLSKWRVAKWSSNYWRDCAQLKMEYVPLVEIVHNDVLEKAIQAIEKWGVQPLRQVDNRTGKIGTVLTADFHLGAEVKNLVRTPNYSTEILLGKLDEVAAEINGYNLKEVHYCFLGDFWESLSGLNHLNTFKSLESGMYGGNAIIYGHKIFASFLSKIINLKSINLVTGNHDRFSNSKEIENTGEGGKVLAYLLSISFPTLEIDCNDLILVKKIDGINYLLTHGDKNLNNKEISKIVFDYGDNTLFNFFVEGHKHTRVVKKTNKLTYYEDYEFVGLDEQKYRKATIPSLFTGNYFSESIGFCGNSGFAISINNGKGIPNFHDISI